MDEATSLRLKNSPSISEVFMASATIISMIASFCNGVGALLRYHLRDLFLLRRQKAFLLHALHYTGKLASPVVANYK